jgi:uncharacterized repeat protein (TIGR01451 family)
VLVANVQANQDGVELDNVASVQADNTDLATGVELLDVVEPVLTIEKSVLSPAGPVDAGDIITYQVVLQNTGTSTAYDVTFIDTAPDTALFIGIVTALDANGNPIGTFVIAPDGTTLTGSGLDIPVGGTVTLVYTMVASDTLTFATSSPTGTCRMDLDRRRQYQRENRRRWSRYRPQQLCCRRL